MKDRTKIRLFKILLMLIAINIILLVLYKEGRGPFESTDRPEFYVVGETVKVEEAQKTETTTYSAKSDVNIEETVSKKQKKEEEKPDNILLIGDSNIYIMSHNRQEYEKKYKKSIVYWLAESGISAEVISPDLHMELGKLKPSAMVNTLSESNSIDLKKEILDKQIKEVAVLLGINSLNDTTADSLIKILSQIKKQTDCQVYYMTILPFVNKGRYALSNNEIVRHNANMIKKLDETGMKYIDSHSIVKNMYNYGAETVDGVHYSERVYDAIFYSFMEELGIESE